METSFSAVETLHSPPWLESTGWDAKRKSRLRLSPARSDSPESPCWPCSFPAVHHLVLPVAPSERSHLWLEFILALATQMGTLK